MCVCFQSNTIQKYEVFSQMHTCVCVCVCVCVCHVCVREGVAGTMTPSTTQSPPYSLTHSLAYKSTHTILLTHPSTDSLLCLLTHLLTPAQSRTDSTHGLTHPQTHSLTPVTPLLVDSPTHSRTLTPTRHPPPTLTPTHSAHSLTSSLAH